MTRRKIAELVIGVALLAMVVSLARFLTGPNFNRYVRQRIVSELENVTGGSVELKGLRWNLSKLEFEARDLTIHGLEAPNELPYAHLDALHVRAKLISLLEHRIGLRQLVAERPLVHIIVYPDGSTNQPVPKIRRESHGSPIDRLFDLAVDRLELRNGELFWNDQRMPLNLTANDVAVGVSYAPGGHRYDGQLNVGKLDGQFRDYRPVSSNAEVRFSLGPKEIELKALRWSSQNTRLEASGRVTDLLNPKVEIAYNLIVDLRQAGAIARVRQLQGGEMEVHGQGAYSLRDFSSAGKVFFRDLDWRQPGIALTNVNLGSDFSVTRKRLSLAQIDGRVLGGSIEGSLEITNWLASAPKQPGEQPQTGVAKVRFEGVDLERALAAISTSDRPWQRINAAGSAQGTLDASWKNVLHNASVQVNLTVVPPAQAAPNQIPVNATFSANYNGAQEVLNVAKLQLATRTTALKAAGILAKNSKLAVDLVTSDLREFRQALAAFNIAELPVDVDGRAAFKGSIAGRVSMPAIAGHLEVADFDSLIAAKSSEQRTAPAASANQPPPAALSRMHWDLLTADLELSPAAAAVHSGTLKREQTHIAFGASAGLQQYRFAENSPFKASVNVKDASVSELQQLAGFNYPVDGKVNFRANLEGTKLNPKGSGRLQVTGGALYGQPFQSLTSELGFTSGEAQLRNVILTMDGGRTVGSGAYNFRSRVFRFDVEGSNINLAEVRRLQTGKFQVAGLVGFRAQGSGTAAAPAINASLEARQLVINGEAAGDLRAQATTRGSEMVLTARSNFQNSELIAEGTVQLRGDLPANIDVKFARLDLDPLLRTVLRGGITEHSSAEGVVRIHGPLRRLKDVNALAEVQQFRVVVEGIALENRGPMRFTLANERINIERLAIVGEGTDVTAVGGLPLAKRGTADLRANGRVNLKLLQSFNRDLLAYGLMTLAVTVGGDISEPTLSGTVQISQAGISIIDLPNGLSDINGTMVFNENQLQIQTLTARTGGGELNLGGFISYSSGFYANLTVRSKDIRLRSPPGISAVADADLRFVGNAKRSTLSGEVTVTKFGVNPRFDFALYLARSNQPPSVPNPDSPLNNLELDVHVVSTPELQVQTSLAKISGDADLRVRGTATRPVVLGRVNILEGDVFFSGTTYHLDRGDISFANPLGIKPVLNLEASARVRDVDISLGFHGPVDHLTVTYRSDPPLPTTDIIALLALGRTPEDAVLNQQTTPNLTETASSALLSQAADAIVSSRMQRLFGVSRIKIDPQVGGLETNTLARVTLEQQVSDKVTLTYITNVTQSAQQIIQVEVHINKRVSVLGTRDQNGIIGFDLKIRQRKW